MTTWQNPKMDAIDHKMRLYPTKVINLIGGPGSEKSLVAAAMILDLNIRSRTVESVPDFAKIFVWQKDFEMLKNQYFLAQKQYQMLHLLDGEYQYLIAEGSLPQLLYYNEHHPTNVCDIQKTDIQIKKWYEEFDNINIFIERSEKPYINAGKYQNEHEARKIDVIMKESLDKNNIPYVVLKPDLHQINEFCKKNLT